MASRVLIVGGGPAGSACGITTAKSGLETVLFEKDDQYREKVCGDGLIYDAQVALKRLGVFDEVRNKAKEILNVRIYGRGKTEFALSVPCYTLQRKYLDQILRNELINCGGTVKYKTKIRDVHITDNKIDLIDNNNLHHAGDILVLATGVNTSLAQKIGFEIEGKAIPSIRGYALNPCAFNEYTLWFDQKAPPSYGWVFPCPGNLINVGYYMSSKEGNVRDLFERFLNTKVKEKMGSLEFIEPPKGSGLRVGFRNKMNYGNRVILVGENINSTYSLLGEGIGNALRTGIIAGETIGSLKGNFGAEDLRSYQEKVIRELSAHSHGQEKARQILATGLGNWFFSHLLQKSERARSLLIAVMKEELSPEQVFSFKGIIRSIF